MNMVTATSNNSETACAITAYQRQHAERGAAGGPPPSSSRRSLWANPTDDGYFTCAAHICTK